MTSPIVDLEGIMPYGVTVEGKGDRNAEIVTESNFKNSNISLNLPDGPCRVAASWNGRESVRLVHSGHGYPVVIPAGGGIVPGQPHSALQQGKHSFYRTFLPRPSHAVAAEQSRCTHSHSSNRRGGGVGDHTTGSTGQCSAVRDSLQDRRRGLHGARVRAAHYQKYLHPGRRCVSNSAGLYRAGGGRGVVETRWHRRNNNHNMPDSCRPVGHSTLFASVHDSGERGGAVVDYDQPAPERRRSIYLNRVAAYLPTTQIAAGGITK